MPNSISRTSMLRMSVLPDSGLRVTADDFQQSVKNVVKETHDSLNSIWTEAGYEETECQGLLGDILTKIKNLCAAELSAEQQILDHAKQQVTVKLEEFSSLCSQLGRTAGEEEDFGENFADRLAELEKRIYDIGIEISERSEMLNTKMEEIESIRSALGEKEPLELEGDELSDARLESMNECISKLTEARATRVKEMREVAEECLKAMTDLVVQEEGVDNLPHAVKYSDLDQAVLNMTPDIEFPFLHCDDYSRLVERAKSLSDEKERRRSELSSNGTEIARMWTQLRVPTTEREQFQSSFKMNLSMETINKGRSELARLKELRLSSLETVIKAIREEISGYWDELGVVSDAQRESEFPMYFSEISTLPDSSVEDHENFCVSLKEKVDVLRPILSKISKRESIVEERIELERIMLDPERLRARGPKAREDRKREEEMSRRVKGLEKFTKDLLHQIELWEQQTEAPFLYAGERYVDRVNAQEEDYVETKLSLRNARRKKDGKPESNPPSKMTAKKFSSTLPSSSHSSQGHTPGLKKAASTLHPSTPASSAPLSKMRSTSSVKKTPSRIPQAHKENHSAVSNEAENIPKQTRMERSSSGSHCSGETLLTSATEVKERGSTCTLQKEETY